MTREALPLGIQTFENIIQGHYYYVDKTDLVYKVANGAKFNFLSRPRRFGKSLLTTTLQSYFEGRDDLFKGLKIDSLETDWIKYPVLRFDFNNGVYKNREGVVEKLSRQLKRYEKKYGISDTSNDIVGRFEDLILEAYEQTGQKVVVLVDEYEKPILESIHDPELQECHRSHLKPFFGTLKSFEQYIRFVLLTGVTRMGHLSVFSDLNNILNLSLVPEYSTICGFTEEEMVQTFSYFINKLGEKKGWSFQDSISELRKKYDGYRFSEENLKVYNPYSLLNCFYNNELEDYWFDTGTPSFLIKIIRRKRLLIDKLERCEATAKMLTEIDDKFSEPIPLLYQSGYLTIVDCFKVDNQKNYILDFPNEEVKKGFFESFLRLYSQDPFLNVNSVINQIVEDIAKGNAEGMVKKIGSIIMSLPYSPRENYEFFYQDAAGVIFMLLGIRVHLELKMLTGSVDCVVEDKEFVYIIEFKVDKSPEEALKQIYNKRYSAPFEGSGKKIIRIGVNFQTDPRDYTYIIE